MIALLAPEGVFSEIWIVNLETASSKPEFATSMNEHSHHSGLASPKSQ